MPDFMANNPFVQGFSLGLNAYQQAAGRSAVRQQLGMEQQRLSMDQQRMFEAAQYNALRVNQLKQEIDQSEALNPFQRQILANQATLSAMKTQDAIATDELVKTKQEIRGQILADYVDILQSFSKEELPDMSRLAMNLKANPDLVAKDPVVNNIFKSSANWPEVAQNIAFRKAQEAAVKAKAQESQDFPLQLEERGGRLFVRTGPRSWQPVQNEEMKSDYAKIKAEYAEKLKTGEDPEALDTWWDQQQEKLRTKYSVNQLAPATTEPTIKTQPMTSLPSGVTVTRRNP